MWPVFLLLFEFAHFPANSSNRQKVQIILVSRSLLLGFTEWMTWKIDEKTYVYPYDIYLNLGYAEWYHVHRHLYKQAQAAVMRDFFQFI